MVVIRLARGGCKHRPKYRITVADQRRSATGRYIEVIGSFNPMAQENETSIVLDMEKAKAWMGKGAQPTNRVKSLMKKYEAAAQ